MDELSKQDQREAAQDLAAEQAASESGAAGGEPTEPGYEVAEQAASEAGAAGETPAELRHGPGHGSSHEAGGGVDDGGGEYDGVPIATFGFLDHLRPDFWD